MNMPTHDDLLTTLYTQVYDNFEQAFSGIISSQGHLETMTRDALNPNRSMEQLEALVRHTGLDIRGKRILEIGAGHGLTVACARLEFGAEAFGIEPGDTEFEGALGISSQVLKLAGLPDELVQFGVGEAIPHQDATFDCVFSSNVLEHVHDPQKVIDENLRVLKPGGFLHIVVPNYGSWWEGHYGVLWFPRMPAWLAKLYIRMLGRDPSFIDTLQLINHGMLERMLSPYKDTIEIIGWGQDVWQERVTTANFSAWSTLGTVKRIVQFLQRTGLTGILVGIGKKLNWETPIILTVRKLAVKI